jgi:Mrp family chromosome partitioning ATPase
MTTTNQAFIKIYRQDEAQLVPSSPIVAQAPSASVAGLAGASVEFVGTAQHGGRRSGEPSPASGALVATTYDVLPPPAVTPVFAPRRSRGSQRPTRPAPSEYEAAPRRVDAPSTKKPLSAFIGGQHAARPAADSSDTSRLSAGTTVASFRWPMVCRLLAQQCGAELDRVIDEMLSYTGNRPTVVGVLGLFPRVGCSTITLCLAARLAGRERRAILVDGNFSNPRLAQWLDVVPTVGWQETLVNGTPLGEAIVHATYDRIDLLAQSGERPDNPLELVASHQTSRTATMLREAYELMLVDLGAFFDPRMQPLALELVRQMGVDAVLAVAGPDGADPRDLATVAEHLEPCGCGLLGVVENRTAKPQAGGAKPRALDPIEREPVA